MKSLLDRGLLTPGQELTGAYRGENFHATVTRDGRVEWNGRLFESPSTAAVNAKRSLGDLPGRQPYPQTNGWLFWKTVHDGEQVMLDTLRRLAD